MHELREAVIREPRSPERGRLVTATAALPIWAIYVAGVGSPVAAFLAVLAGNWVSRRGQKEAQARERRAEALKVLQWASELAVSEDEAKAAVGATQLEVLADFELDADMSSLVSAAFDCITSRLAEGVGDSVVGAAAPRVSRRGAGYHPTGIATSQNVRSKQRHDGRRDS